MYCLFFPPKALLDASVSCHNYTKIWTIQKQYHSSKLNVLKSDFVPVLKNEIIISIEVMKDFESLTVISVESYCKVL